MTFISALIFIAAAADTSEPVDYKTAYNRAMTSDKPLLVLVTAEWCPPCQVMKNTTIPKLVAENKLHGVHFATVDLDKDSKTARQIIGNMGVPQLVLFEKKGDEWDVKRLTGIQSVAAVESFIGPGGGLRTAAAEALAK